MDLKAWKFHQNSFPPFSSLSPCVGSLPSKIPIYSQKMVSTVLGWHGQNSVYSGCFNFSKGQWVNYHWFQRPWLGPHVHLGTNHNILIGHHTQRIVIVALGDFPKKILSQETSTKDFQIFLLIAIKLPFKHFIFYTKDGWELAEIKDPEDKLNLKFRHTLSILTVSE